MKVSPYFKVRCWEGEQSSRLFVFVGDNVTSSTRVVLDKVVKSQSIATLSKSEQQALLQKFGDSYVTALGLDMLHANKTSITFVYGTISLDDNINWLKQKLFYYLFKELRLSSHEDFYIWITKKFRVTPLIIQTFLNNCFKSEKRISTDYFMHSVSNLFGVQPKHPATQFVDHMQARSVLESMQAARQTEPILFHYTSEDYYEYVNYHPLKELRESTQFDGVEKLSLATYNPNLLESFDVEHIVDGCLDAVTVQTYEKLAQGNMKLVGKYFPFAQSVRSSEYMATTLKFVEDIEEVEKQVRNYEPRGSHQLDTFTNFLHFRVNEVNANKNQDLETLFEKLKTSQDVPFIKYKAVANTYYKVHKDTMPKLRNELLGKWTESKTQQLGKSSTLSYILLKIHYTKDVYCSLLIFDTLFYDVKFTFGSMMRETSTNILKFLTKVDVIIKGIQDIFPAATIPTIDKTFLSEPTATSNTKVLRWLTTNSIKSDKHNLNYNNFVKVVKNRMFSYFNIINNPNKNILHLQYKKIDNYLKFENIQVYITNHHYIKNKAEMIRNIQTEFNLSPEEAEREYEKWTSHNELEMFKMGDKTFIKPKNDNYVNVKIRLTSSIDLNFNIEGAKNNMIQDRIVRLLLILMDMSSEKIVEKKGISNTKVDTILYGTTSMSRNSDRLLKRSTLAKSSKRLSGLTKSSQSDELADLEMDVLEDYNDFGEMFEDDEDLKALEQEFMKELQAEEKLNGNKQPAKMPSQEDDDDDAPAKNGDEDSVMKSYFMNMLKSADKELIDYKVPKGQKVLKRYSTVCQWNDRRQPVVVNQAELDKIKGYQKDIRYVKTGSTQELQNKNFYICPQVWCPKSKVSLTYKDFKEKYNESCPDPNIEEKPILLTNHYWGKGDAGLTREHFPGFLDPKTHPGRMCLPCCFKKEAKEGSRNKQNENTCKNQFNDQGSQDEETEVFGNEKYILGEIFVPLEPFRYGLLPKEVHDLVGNKTCGNGLDGKGLMNDKTDCILRRGVNQKSQSFLNALVNVLDNPAITNLQTLIDNFNANISVEQFVALENGKIMKLFINKEYSIFTKAHFKDFAKWLLNKEQRTYIKMFKLEIIRDHIRDLVASKPEEGFLATETNKKMQRTIIREFLIYNAYTHFLAYMNDMSTDKHHNLLIDYIHSEHTWLNINNYNLVVIEHDPTDGKTHMICPYNRNAASVFDTTDPFVFIFKQNNYYEPLCHVKVRNGNIDAKTRFWIKTAPLGIRKLIQYYMKNCSADVPINTATDLEIFIEGITGHAITKYVIDYSFQICGFLISGINLFVPLKTKVDIYDLNHTEFIYYDDLPKYKCNETETTIHAIFTKIYKRTADPFYKATEYVYDETKQRLIGVRLNSSYFVPTNYNEKTDGTYISEIFDDDLNVFVEYEKKDARVERVTRDQQLQRYFKTFTTLLTDYISTHKELSEEFVFLKDPENPFPKEYKRKKLLQIVAKAMANNDFTEYVNKQVDIKQFTRHFVEDILLTTGSMHSVMLRQMFGMKRKYKKESYELMFDQKDVLEGRIQEKLKFIQNPYASLMERVDKYMREYVFEYAEKEEMEFFKRYMNRSTIPEDVPYKFRKLMAGFKLISYGEHLPYTPDTLYDMFLSICKAKHITTATDIPMIRHLMQQKMFQAMKHDDLDLFYLNESYKHTAKLLKLRSHTIDHNLQVMNSMTYYPSYFELTFLVELAKVRIIVVGRKTKTNDTGIEVIPNTDKFNKYNRFVILNQYYDRFNNRDVFQFAVKGVETTTPRIILRRHEVPPLLLKYIEPNGQ